MKAKFIKRSVKPEKKPKLMEEEVEPSKLRLENKIRIVIRQHEDDISIEELEEIFSNILKIKS